MNAGLAEVVRWVNVGLASLALAVLLATIIRRWDLLPHRVRRIGLAFCGLLTVSAYSSGEAATMAVPPGFRVLLVCISLLALVFALLWRFDEDI